MNDAKPKTQPLAIRPETKAKFVSFAKTRRMPIVEVADVAIDALNQLPKDRQDALIERRNEPAAA